MTINTGKTPITITTLAAILSLSLVVNLPGLAVSPMLSTLSKIFPGTTQTEKQLLTIMPNLIIIPFVLLSGKLSLSKHKIATIVWGLILFVASSVAYMFARTMGELIVISCLLGCGAGLIIPFAAGLIADCFVGKQRMKVMGWKSGISNVSLVVATFAVGWLSTGNWHLPFIVYLIGIVPLVMALKLKGIPAVDLENPQVPDDVKAATKAGSVHPNKVEKIVGGFYLSKISQVLGVYAFITFACMIVGYYTPFMVQAKHLPDSLTGTITAIFYLFVFLPGFFLTKIVQVGKAWTFVLMSILMVVGMGVFAFIHVPWLLCVGAALVGLGYGTCQPLIYDKASRTVDNPIKATLALAIVLTANYVAIAIAPFIVDLFRDIFHAGKSETFPFIFGTAVLAIYFVVTLFCRNTFGLAINKTYYN